MSKCREFLQPIYNCLQTCVFKGGGALGAILRKYKWNSGKKSFYKLLI